MRIVEKLNLQLAAGPTSVALDHRQSKPLAPVRDGREIWVARFGSQILRKFRTTTHDDDNDDGAFLSLPSSLSHEETINIFAQLERASQDVELERLQLPVTNSS